MGRGDPAHYFSAAEITAADKRRLALLPLRALAGVRAEYAVLRVLGAPRYTRFSTT